MAYYIVNINIYKWHISDYDDFPNIPKPDIFSYCLKTVVLKISMHQYLLEGLLKHIFLAQSPTFFSY